MSTTERGPPRVDFYWRKNRGMCPVIKERSYGVRPQSARHIEAGMTASAPLKIWILLGHFIKGASHWLMVSSIVYHALYIM